MSLIVFPWSHELIVTCERFCKHCLDFYLRHTKFVVGMPSIYGHVMRVSNLLSQRWDTTCPVMRRSTSTLDAVVRYPSVRLLYRLGRLRHSVQKSLITPWQPQ